MMGAGTLGVSVRHWDMAFPAGAARLRPRAAYLMMGLIGIAGLLAAAGVELHLSVWLILFGKLDRGHPAQGIAADRAARPLVQHYGSAGFAAPLAPHLAVIFLVAFVLYYFVNWKYLAELWGLS